LRSAASSLPFIEEASVCGRRRDELERPNGQRRPQPIALDACPTRRGSNRNARCPRSEAAQRPWQTRDCFPRAFAGSQ
jgi:hypothetical protein